jgi:hypothetical protein
MHARVTACPSRGSDLESLVAVTKPELKCLPSSRPPTECWAKLRQLARFRQPEPSQIPKNHLFRIGPPSATQRSDQSFQTEFGCSRFRGNLTEGSSLL